MRVLRVLSFIAVLTAASGAAACPIHTTAYEQATEAKIIALLDEPILLNSNSDQSDRLRMAELALASAPEEPVLLNSMHPRQDETIASDWIDLEALPQIAAFLDVPPLRVVVDDEGILLLDVTLTGSITKDPLALDGFEDR
jgi:hypothetical protein